MADKATGIEYKKQQLSRPRTLIARQAAVRKLEASKKSGQKKKTKARTGKKAVKK